MSEEHYAIAEFHYAQNEYSDGDVYIPARSVKFVIDTDKAQTLKELVDSFKEFVQAIGFTYAQSEQITLRPYDAEDEG
jgi:hypothetical protein